MVCVDVDQRKIDKLNNGQIPIYEPEEMQDLKFNYYSIGRKPVITA